LVWLAACAASVSLAQIIKFLAGAIKTRRQVSSTGQPGAHHAAAWPPDGESGDEMRAIVCSALMALAITTAGAQAEDAREIMSCIRSCRNIEQSC
jgi:hypothetical protein